MPTNQYPFQNPARDLNNTPTYSSDFVRFCVNSKMAFFRDLGETYFDVMQHMYCKWALLCIILVPAGAPRLV